MMDFADKLKSNERDLSKIQKDLQASQKKLAELEARKVRGGLLRLPDAAC